MKKLSYLLCIMMLFSLISCGSKEEKKDTETKTETAQTDGAKKYKIGITQIVSHPALDQSREGFKDALKEAGMDVEYEEQNAQGDITIANTIANKFVTDKVDLIFSIATPTTQAAVNATGTIPIVFTAVTDPEAAGLTKPNVTGSSDRVDNVAEQLDVLKELNPNATAIGILYNSSEQNSVTQVELIKKIAAEKGIKVEEQAVTSVSELTQALDNLLSKTDALYIPTDNLVVSNMPAVVERAIAAKKIVIATDEGSVTNGALYTKGIDFYELGKEAGKLAVQILKDGKTPSDLKVVTLKPTNLVFNKKTMEAIGLTLPEKLKNEVKFVD
ncbi:ABC transporter substrate-binding protein [Sebaldella sp. S0638]|uniref:ABC transporter substrate-binding protein n=1 Tax=Sebaldella sp. S0638 TaxID=2957809 RepID=UPI0020A1FA2B|nr:ABC transporter substrate-binding protein [Sebaldella sp. S0638]MCP1223437.1 ABC transporter substrate-binding protein [Sebaldella sp. S0638]